jgi:hypothetical protein
MDVARLRKHHEEVTSRSHREAAIMGLEAGLGEALHTIVGRDITGLSAFTAGA